MLRPLPRQSAHAAKHAAAPDEWPLGKEKPEKPARGPISGRGRSTSTLTMFVATFAPPTATSMKRITPHERVGATSKAATIAQITKIAMLLPSHVNDRRIFVLTSVESSEAQRAMSMSRRTTADCRRISKARRPTTTRRARATSSARPVASDGLIRRRSHVARPCSASRLRRATRATAWTGPWVTCEGSRRAISVAAAATAPATNPATTKTSKTNIGAPEPRWRALSLFPITAAGNRVSVGARTS